MNTEEFKSYLQIDKDALDDEIVQQPSLFYRVSETYVQVASKRDALKEQLARVDAELDAEVRDDLDKSDAKVTEAIVKNQVQCSLRHEQAFKAYLAAKEEADLLTAMKEAFHMRGYMLRDLVQLHVANYFENSAIRGTAQTDRHRYDQQRATMAEARKKRQR